MVVNVQHQAVKQTYSSPLVCPLLLENAKKKVLNKIFVVDQGRSFVLLPIVLIFRPRILELGKIS